MWVYLKAYSSLISAMYSLNCRGAQLLERSVECMDKNFDLLEKEKQFSHDLFEQFLSTGGCEQLIAELERVAEEWLGVMYPNSDLRVVGRPRFTFNLEAVRMEGSYSYNRELNGVGKNTFTKVCL